MLSDVLQKLVGDASATRDLGPGEFLFRQGDRAEHVFALIEGRVRLTRYLSNGKTVCMHVARAGQTFAEGAVISDVYHCNAVADAKSRVRMYKKRHILDAISRDSSFALEYIAALSREVQRLRTQLELHNIQSARERILQFFLLESRAGSSEVHIDGSFKELASDLGLAHETFYRELARLQDDHIISRQDKVIRLHKLPPV